jgi:nucleoside phosphorylase
LRLLLDEMFPAVIAEQLRQRGHDVDAVCERSTLRGRPDADVFAAAQDEGRVVVTENVPDYLVIARDWETSERVHHGVIFTTDRRFPRHRASTIGRLVRALADLLAVEPEPAPPSNREIWL